MGILGDIRDRITGRKDEPEKLSPQQQFEQKLAKDLNRMEDTRLGITPQQIQHRADVEQVRANSAQKAEELKQPRPAEKMVSYKDLFTERTKNALKEERAAQRTVEQEVAGGTRPVSAKAISDLHRDDSGPSR